MSAKPFPKGGTTICDLFNFQHELPPQIHDICQIKPLADNIHLTINVAIDPLEWLSCTDMVDKLNMFLNGVAELSNEVNRRVSQRALSSIFD